MLIPIIPKDPERGDLNCRDGEVDFVASLLPSDSSGEDSGTGTADASIPAATLTLSPEGTFPTANIRVALLDGEREKASLMLNGEISRVDPATADRITQAITLKAAEALLDISTDLRRQGLFLLPFRAFTMAMTEDGTLSYPTPQAVALPVDYPPHPEITAAAATDDCLTLALRFPARPHRLEVSSDALPEGWQRRTFISYPLYIPDPKDMRGSLGSVRSATGGNATGLRFAFLSASAIKASVAAPEKYYELVGNRRTGYRLSTKAAAAPDYSCYAAAFGHVGPFPRQSLLATGEGADGDTDPLDWIADWLEAGKGYLPASLPYKYRSPAGSDGGSHGEEAGAAWPEGIDAEQVRLMAEALGAGRALLTRPMALADAEQSRRHAEPRGIARMRVEGLRPDAAALAVLYGSADGAVWTPMRSFDPRRDSLLLAPPRRWWRLLLLTEEGLTDLLTGAGGRLAVRISAAGVRG